MIEQLIQFSKEVWKIYLQLVQKLFEYSPVQLSQVDSS